MKNLLFLGLAMCAIVFTTSCKKDYTCTCTDDTDGTEISSTPLDNLSKSDAEDGCAALDVVPGISCTLD